MPCNTSSHYAVLPLPRLISAPRATDPIKPTSGRPDPMAWGIHLSQCRFAQSLFQGTQDPGREPIKHDCCSMHAGAFPIGSDTVVQIIFQMPVAASEDPGGNLGCVLEARINIVMYKDALLALVGHANCGHDAGTMQLRRCARERVPCASVGFGCRTAIAMSQHTMSDFCPDSQTIKAIIVSDEAAHRARARGTVRVFVHEALQSVSVDR